MCTPCVHELRSFALSNEIDLPFFLKKKSLGIIPFLTSLIKSLGLKVDINLFLDAKVIFWQRYAPSFL